MNIDLILQPIRPDAPAGDDLSFSAEFDSIAEARREEDATLDQGDWVRDVKEADWPTVIALAGNVLQSKSKDIRVAGWLLEGMGKLEGFGGLARGLEACQGLIESFWDDLYPKVEDGDNDERVGALGWVVQRAVAIVQETKLTQAAQGAFSWQDFESAKAWQNRIERDPDLAEEAGEQRVTMERIRSACAATPVSVYEGMQADFARLRQAARLFEQAIDARLGVEGPSFAPLRETLDTVGALVDRLVRDAGVGGAIDGEDHGSLAVDADNSGTVISGPIKTRKQALLQLRQVADYFRRTEPHSPVAYLADKAANWGDMSLHDWLKQVVKDGGALAHIEELLGVEVRRAASEE